ncbi:unnamed protein product [Protopolystoma xenopodis]|uniref:Uncharacterized protein n=1 Tax=Protopolystoma xenopodis TaxID=117903 RepID=A0A3S4ZCL9_9PLAT|nr:unnamed protein product [Protopolystoma xenopodis]
MKNPIILGIAISRLLNPGHIEELMYMEGGHFLGLAIARLVVLVLIAICWSILYQQGYASVYSYLEKRYASRLICHLYLISSVLEQMKAIQVFKIRHRRSLLSHVILEPWLLIALGASFSLGCLAGLQALVFHLVIFTLIGFSIRICLAVHLKSSGYAINNFSATFAYSTGRECADFSPFPGMLHYLTGLITAQPSYSLYRQANSLRQANLAVSFAVVINIAETLISWLCANGIHDYSMQAGIAREKWLLAYPAENTSLRLYQIKETEHFHQMPFELESQMNGTGDMNYFETTYSNESSLVALIAGVFLGPGTWIVIMVIVLVTWGN